MESFAVSYALTIIQIVIAGVFMLGILKKLRDEKAKKEKAFALLAARREDRG
jgi:hypothetical protein